jgi:hypothetical protein
MEWLILRGRQVQSKPIRVTYQAIACGIQANAAIFAMIGPSRIVPAYLDRYCTGYRARASLHKQPISAFWQSQNDNNRVPVASRNAPAELLCGLSDPIVTRERKTKLAIGTYQRVQSERAIQAARIWQYPRTSAAKPSRLWAPLNVALARHCANCRLSEEGNVLRCASFYLPLRFRRGRGELRS